MKNIKLFGMGIILVLVSFVSAHTGDDEYAHHSMMNDMYGMMSGTYGFGGMWLFGWVFMILVIVALVLLIIWLIKQIQKN